MPKKDPITEARDELKRQQAAEAAQEQASIEEQAKVEYQRLLDEQKARLAPYIEQGRVYKPPTRQFEGRQGEKLTRRTNIRMREWRIYAQALGFDIEYEKYFVALFAGLLTPESLELSDEDRIALGQMVTDEMLTDEYLPLKDAIFDDILMPTASKSSASEDEKSTSASGAK